MKCSVTELEIETIYNRIKNNDIKLQPDFQRGEVWTDQRKKKLIDSILRGWKIPPIHVIEGEDYLDEVLDGQQRLVTIRDFINNETRINGQLPPIDKEVVGLDGLYFRQLNPEIQRKFFKYSITFIRLTQYSPQEPAELFYRLNQPATLTSAEQRNAFIGKTRNQVKELVKIFEESGADKETIGFSNSRMAYDEVISKMCYAIEINTISKKITSNMVSDKYRMDDGFEVEVIESVKYVLQYFIKSLKSYDNPIIKLSINKATLFSWLIFTYKNMNSLSNYELGEFIYTFESVRQAIKGKELGFLSDEILEKIKCSQHKFPFFQSIILMFNQRASMGSTDGTSIVYRDIILQLSKEILVQTSHEEKYIEEMTEYYREFQSVPKCIEMLANKYNWGDNIRYERS
ncbi:TPA: DUF262 domain-containing protein [Clostridium perfringens]|uniref:DUF262 domain-containing protein n=1 Tax=Clostridium perfringens TaxID=1502 RepID=UPI0014427C5A|nr:DUF262 domain-containing protein [Clostridium perfringens]